ncbi:MAG: ABC transporter permease, partial [Halalkalicoccus sp.]
MTAATTEGAGIGVGPSLRERLRRALADTQTRAGAAIVGALIAIAVVGPLVVPHDPLAQDLTRQLQEPSLAHPFGTDPLGRDQFARVVYGARLSLGIAAVVTAVRLSLGVLVGLVSGYLGGWVDELLMRFVDLLFAFPG